MRRLFWRAGFGATADEARHWRARGRRRTLDWVLAGDGAAQLRGPDPSADGKPLDPVNVPGHAVLWWLDRMVRTTRPLEEKMTLLWHDHFATRDSDRPLMLRQNETLRRRALGRFDDLLRDVTLDPAMQLFLSLTGSHKSAPNENFARELMELFTIGTGYTEDDIREASRALTGFVVVVENGRVTGIRFEPSNWDPGPKTIFGHTGAWKWDDVLRLCLEHPAHPAFLVTKVWDFFVPTPIPEATRRRLTAAYVRSGRRIAPLVRRILEQPELYADLHRPSQVKWPAVYVAGQLRQAGAPVRSPNWHHHLASMGQTLFHPPSVAGWDWNEQWLSSNAMRARFVVGNELVRPNGELAVREGTVDLGWGVEEHLGHALAALGQPPISRGTRLVLERLITAGLQHSAMNQKDEKIRRGHVESLQRAVRHLLVSGPDNQVC